MKCQYHKDCTVLKTAKAFTAYNESQWVDRIMAWLYEGPTRLPDRSAGFQHKQLFGVIWKLLIQSFTGFLFVFVAGGGASNLKITISTSPIPAISNLS